MSATDVARAVRRQLAHLGYRSVLVESRADRVTPPDAPAVGAVEDLDLSAYDGAVLTDHDAPGVTATLVALLRSPIGFIGVMGSRRHVAHYVDELRAAGFADDDLARIRSPLGLDLGGREAGGDRVVDRGGDRRGRARSSGWVARPVTREGLRKG